MTLNAKENHEKQNRKRFIYIFLPNNFEWRIQDFFTSINIIYFDTPVSFVFLTYKGTILVDMVEG